MSGGSVERPQTFVRDNLSSLDVSAGRICNAIRVRASVKLSDAERCAAMCAALAARPGVRTSDKAVRLGDRTGRSIFFTAWNLFRNREELVFDPAAGVVFGTRPTDGTLLGRAIGHGGSVKLRYRTVVDSAPVVP